ncbi:helix-turn-helix domain-containing protein [Candidatus Aquiluna sp. UB-MaderosW2red]|uniref:helix-turn-helix domain-containing protein n=1 Tax=Candidatus Aquiluna sp. UB-MaderosW2red TaxID=1855377 RepID=UPI000875CFC0|nr:helix-turn-helix domain-containing protein [Candidatus Aquiluna sp. UB-MaderosW2red]SCX03945.1 AraC-type DNA-binding protein [Candidatus Aquiluna sp. UB-MaderosW2red]
MTITASGPSEGPSFVDTLVPAIWTRRGQAPRMARSHRHDDLEFNFVLRGCLDYLFGGERIQVPAGHLAMFWGATPHRLIESSLEEDSDSCWLHVPLSTVLRWGLSTQDLNDLLQGSPVIVPAGAAGRDVESMFMSWMQELEDENYETIALIEVHALVRRLLGYRRRSTEQVSALTLAGSGASDSMQRVTAMAQFIVAHFREPITTADVADSVHLNSHYAMSLFRRAVGTTIGRFITGCRVSEAQRLLVTTTLSTSEISPTAGFGSQSSFYAHFMRICDSSPGEYRALHR